MSVTPCDDYLTAGRGSTLIGGNGTDVLLGGAGNDRLTTYVDRIDVGAHSLVVSGGGDDLISVGSDSIVYAGAGDDRVTLNGDSTFHFARGDGNDIIGGGSWGGGLSANR